MNKLIEKKSRTAVKREAENLQKLGEKLARFSVDQIKLMEIPEELKKAVITVKSIEKFGAKRRQFQFIGSIMRNIDPEIVTMALSKVSMGRDFAVEKFKKIEKWRDDLLSGPDHFIEKFIELYPDTDRQRLRILTRNAAREIEKKQTGKKHNLKSFKALFKYIREMSE